MSVGTLVRRICRLSATRLLMLTCFGLAPLAASADCDPACGAEANAQLYASSKEYDAARAESLRRKEERRERRELERRTHRQINHLEKRLKRAERSKKKSSRRRRRGSNDGQAGAHCMYGIDGKLLYKPRTGYCAPRNDGKSEPDGRAPLEFGNWGSQSGIQDKVEKAGKTAPPAATGTGCIKGSCRTGQGTYVWKDGSRYVGGFRNGKQHGQGTLSFADGASYMGSWRDGKRWGQGIAMYADGRMQSGYWESNRFVGGGKAQQKKALAAAPSWPDLSRPARPVGGGSRDAAVIIAIEDYAHVAKVPGARENAADWYKYLVKTRGIPVDRVTLLLDEDATREEMRWTVQEAARLVADRGSLWFVFIGHGAPAPGGRDGLLVGFDAQQKARSLTSRSLPRADLLEVLEGSRAAHVNILLDACFSGQAPGGAQLVAGLQPLVVTSSTPTSDPRITLMTAARSDQFAGPLPGAKRPAFSYLMLGGLRGWADSDKNGQVGAEELHAYVSNAMRALIRGRRQNPTLVGGEGVTLVSSAKESGPDLADLVLGLTAPANASGSR